MKSYFLLLVISFALCSNVYSQEISANSKVSDVTVYRGLAKETRTSTVTVPEGNSEIVLSGITTLMTDPSLQVSVKGNATLLSASVRTNHFTELNSAPKDSKADKLRDSIIAIEIDVRWIVEQRSIINGELSLVNELLKPTNTKDAFKPADLTALTDFYRSRFTDLKKKLFDLTLVEESLVANKNKFQAQLNETGARKIDPVKEIVLSFYSEKGGSLQLKCNYLVTSAGWVPMYDLHVENVSQPVALTYKAKIFQRTGTDWKDVRTTISSANPSVNNNRPLMSPKYVDYATYAFNAYSSDGSISNMMQAERIDVKKLDAANQLNPAITVESDIHVEFVLESKQNIASNGKEHIVLMQDYKVPATYKYHAVPKLDPAAYLLAKITDYGQYNLLAGDANIFFGDTYVGQVQLNPQITADTLLVSLGRDERIVIKRSCLTTKNSKKLFSGIQKDSHGWETVIRNNKGIPIDIEILDQVPLSRRKEIEVKLNEKSGADFNEPYGKLLWNLTIMPNDSKKITLMYTIEYPEGKNVQEL